MAKALDDNKDSEGAAELTAVKQLVQEMQQLVGTKVAIQSVGKTRTMTFTFYSDQELNQFVEKLRKSAR